MTRGKRRDLNLILLILISLSLFFVMAWLFRGSIRSFVRDMRAPAGVPVSEIAVPQIKKQLTISTEPEVEDIIADSEQPEDPKVEEVSDSGEIAAVSAELQPQSDDVLPDSINLAVPFTSQAPEGNWEQPWQDACEEAVVLMLDGYYSKFDISTELAVSELQRMTDWGYAKGWGGSIEIKKIQQFVEQEIGSPGKIIANPSIEEIKKYVADGHPVLVVADGKNLNNPYFTEGGPVYHALIIRGYTPTHFITNDPGTRKGEGFQYTYENLMSSIRDWNGGNVKEGQAVVLVLGE